MRCSKWLALLFSVFLSAIWPCDAVDQTLDLYSGKPEMLVLALNSGDSGSGPSLQDLGFSQNQTQGNSQDQALLDKRSHMLQLHQRWGLATLVPLAATLVWAPGGKAGTSRRTLHGGLGLLTGGMYFTTAHYAFGAPKVPGTKVKGPIRLHKALAWIHFPGMILTPILGVMADEQRNAGQKVHGIASAHSGVAAVTVAAYAAAILSVSIKF
jgi:hypothetical protein